MKRGDPPRVVKGLMSLAARMGHGPKQPLYPPGPQAGIAVLTFAKKHGLKMVGISKGRLEIHLRGTAQALSKAFGIELHQYDFHGQTHTAHANDEPIAIPEKLVPYVLHILPDRRPTTHHRLGGLVDVSQLPTTLASNSTVKGSIQPAFTIDELRQLYSFPEGCKGAGQAIGILSLGGGYYPEDMEAYFADLGVPTPKIVVVGTNAPADKTVTRDVMRWMNTRGAELESHPAEALTAAIMTVETTMDIQAAAAFAPDATIVLYCMAGTSLQDLLDGLAAVKDDTTNAPCTLSCSFAIGEASLPPYTNYGIDYALQELAKLGITTCVASGDFGAQGVSQFTDAKELQVMWPAASVWTVSCGGTRILDARLGNTPPPLPNRLHGLKHIVFREVLGAPIGQMASGGGFSTKVDRPDWQNDAIAEWSSATSNTAPSGRGVPDVALNAHLESSFPILVAGYPGTAGGTSAAAPVMAALVTCFNQSLNTRLGHLTPLLYDPQVACTFITAKHGDSEVSDEIPGYEAHDGWDPCTGLGAPGADLLAALSALHTEHGTQS